MLPRSDALPDHHQYTDDGCPWHPRCLTCPFHRCRYDAPHGRSHALMLTRRAQCLKLRRLGISGYRIARLTGIPPRTVYHLLKLTIPLDKPANTL